MDSDKLLERSLEASGDYLDSTIKSLKELHLESTQAALSATSYTSENGQKEAVQSSVKGTVTNGDVDTTKRGVLCRTAAARRPPVRAAIASGHRRPCSRRAHIHPLAASQWREDWIQIILVLYQSSRSPDLHGWDTQHLHVLLQVHHRHLDHLGTSCLYQVHHRHSDHPGLSCLYQVHHQHLDHMGTSCLYQVHHQHSDHPGLSCLYQVHHRYLDHPVASCLDQGFWVKGTARTIEEGVKDWCYAGCVNNYASQLLDFFESMYCILPGTCHKRARNHGKSTTFLNHSREPWQEWFLNQSRDPWQEYQIAAAAEQLTTARELRRWGRTTPASEILRMASVEELRRDDGGVAVRAELDAGRLGVSGLS